VVAAEDEHPPAPEQVGDPLRGAAPSDAIASTVRGAF